MLFLERETIQKRANKKGLFLNLIIKCKDRNFIHQICGFLILIWGFRV